MMAGLNITYKDQLSKLEFQSPDLNASELETLKSFAAKKDQQGKKIIFDCTHVLSLTEPTVSTLNEYARLFNSESKEVVLLASKSVIDLLKNAEISKIASNIIEFNHLQVAEVKRKHSIEYAEIIDSILASIPQTMIQYAHEEVSPMGFAKTSDSRLSNIAISGTIIFKTKVTAVRFILSFPEDTYLNLVKKILGIEYTEINDENRDWAAEFINLAVNQSKDVLNKNGFEANLGIPQVLTLDELRNLHEQKKTHLILSYSGDSGIFFAEVYFTEIKSTT